MKHFLEAISLAALSFALAGCPVIRLADVALEGRGEGADGATLVMTVEAVEDVEEDSVDRAGKPIELKGIAGIWLPEGWSVTRARYAAPGKDAPSELRPISTGAPFPRTFPYRPGGWWAFVSDCHHVPVGTSVYKVEFDIAFPRGTKGDSVGLILGEYDPAGSYTGSSPVEIAVDVEALNAEIVEKDLAALTPVNVSQGPAPQACRKARIARGPRGCACDNAGHADVSGGLLAALGVALF